MDRTIRLIQLAYAGRGQMSGGKIGVRFFPLNDDGTVNLEKQHLYEKKLFKHLFIGGVWEFQMTEDGSIFPKKKKYIKEVTNKELLIEWEAEDALVETELEMVRKKKEHITAFEKALSPLREEYHKKLGRIQRAAFLAQIIAYVSG